MLQIFMCGVAWPAEIKEQWENSEEGLRQYNHRVHSSQKRVKYHGFMRLRCFRHP